MKKQEEIIFIEERIKLPVGLIAVCLPVLFFYFSYIGFYEKLPAKNAFLVASLSLNPTQDSYLLSVRSDENQGASSAIVISASSNFNNGLLQFDLSGIPAGSTITSATLTMERTSGTIDPSGETIEVRGLTENWVEGSQSTTFEACTNGVTWDERDCDSNLSWSTAGGTYNGTIYASTSVTTGTNTWDVATLVQEWVDGSLTNNGMLLKKQNSSVKVHGFSSRTGTNPPDLTIDFIPPVETNCSDGIDNDNDGLIDCADSDCCCAKAPTLSKN